ncbi:hypothetical protein PsorP6_012031 [Peronosclerospora sorghi]|uniref:Uncharacterized protein n=1 Tax=Peronosclerospora sorghi TaxID=230839 RepID=A0ACC0WKF4_9STRA|nr:hypothetical protein PsorP6_012031 [Peronosclerospora sorghi]
MGTKSLKLAPLRISSASSSWVSLTSRLSFGLSCLETEGITRESKGLGTLGLEDFLELKSHGLHDICG